MFNFIEFTLHRGGHNKRVYYGQHKNLYLLLFLFLFQYNNWAPYGQIKCFVFQILPQKAESFSESDLNFRMSHHKKLEMFHIIFMKIICLCWLSPVENWDKGLTLITIVILKDFTDFCTLFSKLIR